VANVRHRIPVSVAVAPSTPPVGDLIAEVFFATADGQLIRALGRFPVQDGGAIYEGPSRPQDQFWAFRVVELASGRAVFRSGPMLRLPGRPPGPGAVKILRSGGNFGLNLPDGAPEVVTRELQSLPAPLQFVGVELGSDNQRQYVITLRGRLEVQDRVVPFTYIRPLRLVGSLDPGRLRPYVIAELAGSVTIRGANVRPFAAVLDRAISNAVQEQLNASVAHLTRLEFGRLGADFEATTISVTVLNVFPPSGLPGSEVGATVMFWGGTVLGVRAPDPGPVATDQGAAPAEQGGKLGASGSGGSA
jgi:hypothetical protein